MFLSTVILFLQEILEAALLISVLLVLTRVFNKSWGYGLTIHSTWVVYGVVGGSVLGWMYAAAIPTVSEWFDYVGQDIANASILFMGLLFLIVLTRIVPGDSSEKQARKHRLLCIFSMIALVLLSVMREGSEMILYLSGGLSSAENVSSFLSGGAIGTGIGISCGIFLFYSLISLNKQWSLRFSLVLIALISGSMASQVIMMLSQADWAPFTPIAWNSSSLVAETSLGGRLLYALIGYEATPSILQVAAYCFGLLSIASSPLFRHAWFQCRPITTRAAV